MKETCLMAFDIDDMRILHALTDRKIELEIQVARLEGRIQATKEAREIFKTHRDFQEREKLITNEDQQLEDDCTTCF